MYGMSQEESPVFCEVIVSVILGKKSICTCILFRTVLEIYLFYCTVPKLFIKRYIYVLFLILVFIVQVTKLVQFVRFEVSTAVTMMIIIFWEMTPCGSYKNRRFGGSYSLHLQGARVRAGHSLCLYKSLQLRSVTCLHSCTLKMETIRSSETSVLIRVTRCHLPEDDNHLGTVYLL
jgi:hypothetical protein